MTNKAYRCDALVLRRISYGEADRILTLLTKQYGKLRVIAKGVRKIHSRRAPHVEMFTHMRCMIHRGKAMDIITEVEPVQMFGAIRRTLTRIASAYYLCELSDKILPEQESGHQDIFDALIASFQKLTDTDSSHYEPVLDEYAHTLLWSLGYLPVGKRLEKEALAAFVRQVTERPIHSRTLLTKITRGHYT